MPTLKSSFYSAFDVRPEWPIGCSLAACIQTRLDPQNSTVHALNSWLVQLLGHAFQVVFFCNISYNWTNSSTFVNH